MTADAIPTTDVAGRYAAALYDLAVEGNAVAAVAGDLDLFEALISDNADLARLVQSPVFASDIQVKAISAVLDAAKIGGLTKNFIRLAARNRRLFAVQGMIRAYRAIVAHARGEVVAHVTVAEPMNDANLQILKGALNEVTGKQVKVEVAVDPALIGGLTVRIGSRMIDTSVRTKLNSIKHAMKEAG